MNFNFLDWRFLVIVGAFALIVGVLAVIDLILYRKKKDQSRLYMLVEFLPSIIGSAEDMFGAGNGENKLTFVLRYIEGLCAKLRIDYDEAFFTEKIEDILTTPQAKPVEINKEI